MVGEEGRLADLVRDVSGHIGEANQTDCAALLGGAGVQHHHLRLVRRNAGRLHRLLNRGRRRVLASNGPKLTDKNCRNEAQQNVL